MPYKAVLKQAGDTPRKRPSYRVTNAHAYNQSLERRGFVRMGTSSRAADATIHF
jgi:hypothetical protein